MTSKRQSMTTQVAVDRDNIGPSGTHASTSSDGRNTVPPSEAAIEPSGGSGLSTLLISISLVLAVFLVALDTTILSTAIPKITDTFKSFKDVGWYVGVYSLTTAVFQLLFGKFYTIFSVKPTFVLSIAIFEVGSVLCAAAPTSNILILGRALAGIGSAGIFAGAFIVVSQTIPLQWRSIYNGIFGALYGIASVVGPVLGGLLTDKASWRWCFWINLPVGVITVVVIVFCFHPKDPVGATQAASSHPATKQELVRASIKLINLPSTAVLISSVVCLLLALQWGGVEYHWNNGRIIALLTVTAVSTIVFILLQARQKEEAFIPYRVLKQRTVWACCLFSFTAGSSVVILVYYLPIWFQAVLNVSALKSGFLNLPFIISLVAGSLISGALTSLVGYYTPFLVLSSALRAIGAGLLTTLEPGSPSWQYILYQIIYGFGDGCGMQQPMTAVQNVLAPGDIPMGISVLIFTQTLGGAIFIAIGQSVFTDRFIVNIENLVPNTNVSAQTLIDSGATSFRSMVKDPSSLDNVVAAYSKAITQTFLIAVVLACLSLIGAASVEWKKVIPEKQRQQSVAPAVNPRSVPAEEIEMTSLRRD